MANKTGGQPPRLVLHLQDWIASVKVPSEEATALSRMADAAAAAAAFTAEGLRDDLNRPSQQAQRAELAKRAQQASDAVLRGEGDLGGVAQPDRRSYSRLAIGSISVSCPTPFLASVQYIPSAGMTVSCVFDCQHDKIDAWQKPLRDIANTSKCRSVSVLLDMQMVGYGCW